MKARSAAALGAVLLAAGGSVRLGQSKQNLDIEGEPLVVRQAKLLLRLEPARVVVVTGAEEEKVVAALANLPVERVHNPNWIRGMGSSLACGIRAMPERARAALVLLCDQWRLGTEDLESLIEVWAPEPMAAVVTAYDDTTGPPAILPRALFDRLVRLRGDTGAKRVLKRWKGTIRTVPLPNAAIDIDEARDVPGR